MLRVLRGSSSRPHTAPRISGPLSCVFWSMSFPRIFTVRDRRYGPGARQSRLRVMRISGCGLPPEQVPHCRRCATLICRQPGEFVERRFPRPHENPAGAGCCCAAPTDAGPATGSVCDRVGTRLAGSRPDFECRRTVPGGVLGRFVAGAAVPCARHRHRPVYRAGAGGAVPACAVSLADPRTGVEPARPRHRHSPPPGDGAHRYALQQGPDRAGAVARAARADAGLDQADPCRAAFAAAADPRSLGAARAGHGDAGGRLFRRRRRALRCELPRRSTGTACWRRPTSGSMPG